MRKLKVSTIGPIILMAMHAQGLTDMDALLKFEAVEGGSVLAEGQHVVTIESAVLTEANDAKNRFTDKNPQIQVVFVCKAGKIIAWFNVIGYKRLSVEELKAELSAIRKDTKILKQMGLDVAKAGKMTDEALMNHFFKGVECDEFDSEKGEYAVSKVSGTRVFDPERTKKAKQIFARIPFHAGELQAGEEFDFADVVGYEIGIEVKRNAQGKSRVARTMPVTDVVPED